MVFQLFGIFVVILKVLWKVGLFQFGNYLCVKFDLFCVMMVFEFLFVVVCRFSLKMFLVLVKLIVFVYFMCSMQLLGLMFLVGLCRLQKVFCDCGIGISMCDVLLFEVGVSVRCEVLSFRLCMVSVMVLVCLVILIFMLVWFEKLFRFVFGWNYSLQLMGLMQFGSLIGGIDVLMVGVCVLVLLVLVLFCCCELFVFSLLLDGVSVLFLLLLYVVRISVVVVWVMSVSLNE